MWKGSSWKSTYSLLLLLTVQNVHHNLIMNQQQIVLWHKIKLPTETTVFVWMGPLLSERSLKQNECQADRHQPIFISGYSSGWVMWGCGCVSAAVCLPCLAGFGTSERREQVSHSWQMCWRRIGPGNPAASPLTCHCQLPPDERWEWNVSLVQFKRKADVS